VGGIECESRRCRVGESTLANILHISRRSQVRSHSGLLLHMLRSNRVRRFDPFYSA